MFYIFYKIGALGLQSWRSKCHHLACVLIMVAKSPIAENARSASIEVGLIMKREP